MGVHAVRLNREQELRFQEYCSVNKCSDNYAIKKALFGDEIGVEQKTSGEGNQTDTTSS